MLAERQIPFERERALILVALLSLASVAWIVLIWQAWTGESMAMGPTMGLGTVLFLAIWITMMVAMMFPTAAPMILVFARTHTDRRSKDKPWVPTWLFVSSYMVIWIAFGVLAYALAIGGERLAQQSIWVMDNAARIGGAILILAGLYQFSPLKHACLTNCRTPLQFILTNWRDGRWGSFRMGLKHGGYCLGCCWMLFLILFPLGMMNIGAMAVITLLIFAEKSLPGGIRAARLAAVILIIFGLMVLINPDLLPTTMQGDMQMDM